MRIQYLVSDFLFLIGYYIVGYRKKLVLRNLNASFPNKTEKEIRVIARNFYRHLFDTFIESIALLHLTRAQLNRRFIWKNIDLFAQEYNNGQSIACAMGHFGNWDWPANIMQFIPHKVIAIYSRLMNPHFDRFFKDIRTKYGAKAVQKENTVTQVAAEIAQGNKIVVYFLADQRPMPNAAKHWITFLNQETPVLLGLEVISKKHGMSVFYFEVKKVARGYYECEGIKICDDARKTDKMEITNTYFKLLEKTIESQPELYLWSHNRWKFNKKDFVKEQ